MVCCAAASALSVLTVTYSIARSSASSLDTWGSRDKHEMLVEAGGVLAGKIEAGVHGKERMCLDKCPMVTNALHVTNSFYEKDRRQSDGKLDFAGILHGAAEGCNGETTLSHYNGTFHKQNVSAAIKCTEANPECSAFAPAFRNVSKFCSCPCAKFWGDGAFHLSVHGAIQSIPLDSPALPETCRILNDLMGCLNTTKGFCACNGYKKKIVKKVVVNKRTGKVTVQRKQVWESTGEVEDLNRPPPDLRPTSEFVLACFKTGHPLWWMLDRAQGKPKPTCSEEDLPDEEPVEGEDQITTKLDGHDGLRPTLDEKQNISVEKPWHSSHYVVDETQQILEDDSMLFL